MKRFTKLLLYAAVICFSSGISYADISVVALTGQAAPGLPGLTFSSLSIASVNKSGDVVFKAGLSSGGTGIFKLSRGQLSLVVAGGQSIPGSPGLFFGVVSGGLINDSGSIAFEASIGGGSSVIWGIFVASGTSINKVLDTTTVIPGTGGQTVSNIAGFQFNNQGDIAVSTGPTAGSYLLIFSSGVISSEINNAANSFSLNNLGDVAYIGPDGGIYLVSGGANQLIVQSGQSVPNTSLLLNTFQSPVLNDTREVAFINGTNQQAGFTLNWVPNSVVKCQAATLEKIAAFGDPVHSIADATFRSFLSPLIDNSGRVFFVSQYSSPTGIGNAIFMSDSGVLSILIQEGQSLQGVGKFTFIGEPSINNSGVLTFVSNLDTQGSAGIFQLNVPPHQVFFPEVADGCYAGQWCWRTALMLSNPDSSGPASISVSFFNDDGTPMNVGINGTTGSQFSFSLPSSGTLQVETSGAGNIKTGWASIQSEKSLSGISIFSFYDGAGNYVSEMGAPATAATTSFSMFVQTTTDINTGIAIANPNSSPAQVTLTLRDSQGDATGSPVSVTVPANGHIQGYVTDIFPQETMPQGFSGTLDVVSQVPVVGMNERQRGQHFTWLPLIP
jgi:hypothetical protein